MAAPPVCGQPVVRVVCQQPPLCQINLPGQQAARPRVMLPLAPQSYSRTGTPSPKEVHNLTPSSEGHAVLNASPSLSRMQCLVAPGSGGSPFRKSVICQLPQSPRTAARAVANVPCRSQSHRLLPGEPDSRSSSAAGSAAGSPSIRPSVFCSSPRAPGEASGSSSSREAAGAGGAAGPLAARVLGSSVGQQEREAATVRVADLLAHRESLKAEVVRCFKRIAGSKTSINIRGLQNFRTLLALAIGVPLEAMGNLQAEYIRFDFDGDGRLHFNEAYKLVKHHLWMYLKKHGGVSQVDVPHRSLDEAGYRVSKELGRGSQGVAMLAMDAKGQEWCVKMYDKGKMSCGGLSELREEFEAMQRLSCERVAHALEIFQDEKFYYTIGEAYYGGDLTTLKERAEKENVDMSEQWWRSIFRQCFQALAFLHENAMMHCDIKEPNIMLRSSNFEAPEIVLIDFGVSKAMAADDNGKVFGTPGYIPPETFEMKMWFPGGDVFSMGVCALQVVGDQVPRTASGKWNTRGVFIEGCSSLREVMQATLAREPPFHLIPDSMPGLESVVRRLLQKQMALRPRAPQVLQDPWFCTDQDPSTFRALESSFSEHMLGTAGISDAQFGLF